MTLPSSPRIRAGALAASLLVMAAAGLSAHSPPATAFLPEEIVEWEEQVFSGATPYRLVDVDGRDAVQALCEDETASALFHRADIDLTETPVMEWSWRVDATLAGIDETSTSGDDFPARLYVVAQRRILRWRPIAINYVWAHEKPEGADWPNPYSSQVRMVSVRSGPPMQEGRWFTERRNVREDLRRFHGRDVTVLGVVAIMTDCDDTGQRSEGWYGTIRFVPE